MHLRARKCDCVRACECVEVRVRVFVIESLRTGVTFNPNELNSLSLDMVKT